MSRGWVVARDTAIIGVVLVGFIVFMDALFTPEYFSDTTRLLMGVQAWCVGILSGLIARLLMEHG